MSPSSRSCRWLSCILLTAASAPGQQDVAALIGDAAAWQAREVGDGVWLRQRWFAALFGAPQSLTVLELRLERGKATLDVCAPGKLTRTSAMAGAGGALAAINGGFYDTKNGDPVGLLRLDGVLRNPANTGQGSLGVFADGTLRLQKRREGDWAETVDALGAGPMLLRNGAVIDHGEKQRTIRHPRSAIGTAADGRVVWLAVDGRTERAAGMSYEELAQVMAALGCREALNLDGGGSTTLWVAGLGVCNFPCDNKKYDHDGERAVANALLLRAPAVVVVDDDAAELQGDGWQQRTDGRLCHGADFAVVPAGEGERSAVFRAELPFQGRWRAFGWLPEVPGGGVGPWLVALPGSATPVRRVGAAGRWVELGEFDVGADRKPAVTFGGTDGRSLVVDAVRLLQVR